MKLPTLYSRTSLGQTQEWAIEINGPSYRTHEGIVGGQITTSSWTKCQGKNVGRANETSPEEQSEREARAKHKKKIEKGYFEDISKIDEEVFFEPMLARKWKDHGDEVKWPVMSQPKLDGCLSGDSIVEVKGTGPLPLRLVVEQQIEGKIRCYDLHAKRIVYKPITGWAKNGVDTQETIKQWFEIILEDGTRLQGTGNHRVWIPNLQCWRRIDQLNGDEQLCVL